MERWYKQKFILSAKVDELRSKWGVVGMSSDFWEIFAAVSIRPKWQGSKFQCSLHPSRHVSSFCQSRSNNAQAGQNDSKRAHWTTSQLNKSLHVASFWHTVKSRDDVLATISQSKETVARARNSNSKHPHERNNKPFGVVTIFQCKIPQFLHPANTCVQVLWFRKHKPLELSKLTSSELHAFSSTLDTQFTSHSCVSAAVLTILAILLSFMFTFVIKEAEGSDTNFWEKYFNKC